MNRLHSNDNEREQARKLRGLLVLLDDYASADPTLGWVLLDALNAPIGIGDPIEHIDSAIHFAKWMKQPVDSVLSAATVSLRDKVRNGWKSSGALTGADAARAITAVLVRVCLAKLEGAPA